MAEKAAWEFIRIIENRSNMEMVSINPTNVFGPVLDNHYHSSIEWFRTLMHSEIPGIPHYQLDFVDVRDLVDILTKAMTELTRFFCQGDGLFFTEAFPDLEFSCGDSWENTIAFGKDHCEYILEVKEPV